MQPAAVGPTQWPLPPETCFSSGLPDSCSRHKLDTPDLTKLDQAGKTVRGKQLWGKSYGERFGKEETFDFDDII